MNKPNLGSILLVRELDRLSARLLSGVVAIDELTQDDIKYKVVVYDPDTLDEDRFNDSGVKSYGIVSEYAMDSNTGKVKALFYDPFKRFGGESFLICDSDDDWHVEIYFGIDEDDPDYQVFDEDYAKIVVDTLGWYFDYD